jgi:hypothetical protein
VGIALVLDKRGGRWCVKTKRLRFELDIALYTTFLREEGNVKRKHKLYLMLMLAALMLMAWPLAITSAQCPTGSRIYVGGPVTDSTATRGSQANPVSSVDEAFDICQQCPNGAYVYTYNTDQQRYLRAGSCIPEEAEPTGVPLAWPVATALLGVLAIGSLAWGIYTRWRLKRLETG